MTRAVCAWCGQNVQRPILPHGVPFHPQCYALRKVVLRRETVEPEDLN